MTRSLAWIVLLIGSLALTSCKDDPPAAAHQVKAGTAAPAVDSGASSDAEPAAPLDVDDDLEGGEVEVLSTATLEHEVAGRITEDNYRDQLDRLEAEIAADPPDPAE